jgi:hypothetical protein
MMNLKVVWIVILWCCLLQLSLQAQDNAVVLGDWRSHLAYENIQAVTESEDAVFFGAEQSILKVYKEDQSLQHLNKVSGLSDMRIKTLAYNRARKALIIAYTNGNIDLLYDDGVVTNLSAIFTNTNILGDKSVNHIYSNQDNIYFSCSFGLTVYNFDLDAFIQTTFTSTEVTACTQLEDTLFMATKQAIYKGIDDGRNLLDFSQWERQTNLNGLFSSYESSGIIRFNNKIYADVGGVFYYYDVNTAYWNLVEGFDVEAGVPFTRWEPSGNGDFIRNYNFSISYDGTQLLIATRSNKYYQMDAAENMYTLYYPGAWRVKDLVLDQDYILWAADQAGMRRGGVAISVNSPNRTNVADMHVDEDGTLWVAHAQYNTIRAVFDNAGFASYKDGAWKAYTNQDYPMLDTFWDAIRVTSNPVNNKVYVSSFMSGILELNPATDEMNNFDQYTSGASLQGVIGDGARTRVQGITVDETGNVWATVTQTSDYALAVRKLDGTWKGIPNSVVRGETTLQDIVIDRNGYKWIKHITGNVTVFDSGILDDDTDDRFIQLRPDNSELPNINVESLLSDNDGVIWIGTTDGIVIFKCSGTVFDGGCTGNRLIISQDDFNGYLLEGERIVSMAVDGANRKWIGTTNGLFLLSADGYEQLAYLTTENSPLFDNEVTDLAFDGKSGYLYIATGLGIQSIRTESTAGLRRMNAKNIKVFPHPVAPDYDGPIAISNLADMANVRITDVSGRLVYETTALGGQAIWDGADYNGRRAQSGVYLVFVVNEEGTQKGVGKILFIN